MRRKHRTTAAKLTAELNQHLIVQFRPEPVRHELNKAGYHGTATIWKYLFPLSILRRVRTGVEITKAGLQTNGSK